MSLRLVIANRGEIARRILRAGRERGFEIAVISTVEDRDALVRREADAVLEVSSFLAMDELCQAAEEWGADMLHPGYGFLSENADFAEKVEASGITFVGPSPENMRAMGGKESAKAFARRCGVPTLESLGSADLARLPSDQWGAALASRGIAAPFLVKASGGGGGRGMRVVESLEGLPEATRRASEEALVSFKDGTVFVERYLSAPRHVEIQVFGDGQGGGVFLGERECSLQRRHQKVLEEAPSPVVGAVLREAMGRAALALVAETRYRGAGTVEFLLDEESRFFFLEMNTRLQVEHPVTEWVCGVDLVQAQLELAEGRWPASLGDPTVFIVPEIHGVALEARILAEDPRNGFLPTPGPLKIYREPQGEGIRVDAGVSQGGRVNDRFDSMIAKLIVWGDNRAHAVARLSEALESFVIQGCATNLPFLQAVSRHSDYLTGEVSTAWIGAHLEALNKPLLPVQAQAFFTSKAFREALSCVFRGVGEPRPGPAARFAIQNHSDLRIGSKEEKESFHIERREDPRAFTLRGAALRRILEASPEEPVRHVFGPSFLKARKAVQDPDPTVEFWACRLEGAEMMLSVFGETLRLEDPLAHLSAPKGLTGGTGIVRAPMAGKVLEMRVAEGDQVEEAQVLFILESMKMQLEVRASMTGMVRVIHVHRDQILPGPEVMAEIEVV